MESVKVNFTNVDVPAQEILISEILQHFEIDGFEQLDNALLAYIPASAFSEALLKENFALYNYTIENIPAQNWNALWESNFEPVVVGNFCAVRANFHQAIPNVRYELIITPKMSFGTGHHATTYQVIQVMEQLDFTNKTVADFGTGTGVLAVLAEKLGAAKVIAMDNEEWSINNTIENCTVNNCTKVIVHQVEALIENNYEIILANINKNVLLASMAAFEKSLDKDGILILSGILKEDYSDLEKALLQHNFNVKSYTEKNNWLCIYCVKD